MHNSIHYVKVKRDKSSICNICGKNAELSWDHVPPKGSIIYSDVEILSISNSFLEIEHPPKEFSQNGMKFRTICSECNNLIGSKYDTIFNDFILRLINDIADNFKKRTSFEIPVDIELLTKSLFSHLLAAKASIENTVPDELLRRILSDFSSFNRLNVYYWFYPFDSNQVIRDILIGKLSKNEQALVSLLKLYPIAFLVTESNMFQGHLPRLNDYYNYDEKSSTPIEFDTSLFFDYRWPIIVDDDTIIMGGQSINSAVIAVPRYIKLKP